MQSPYVTSTCVPNCASGDLAANSVAANSVDTCDLTTTTINGIIATRYTTTTLTLDQIHGLNTSSVTLIPAPGAGKMIVPGLIEVNIPAGAAFTSLSGADWLQFNYGTAVPDNNIFKQTLVNFTVHEVNIGFFTSVAEQTRRFFVQNSGGGTVNVLGIYGTSTETPVNQPLTVSLTKLGGGVGGGRGNMRVRVYYTVISALGSF